MFRFVDDIAPKGNNKKNLKDSLNGINQILVEEKGLI